MTDAAANAAAVAAADEAAAERVVAAIAAGRLDDWLVRLTSAVKRRRTERNAEAGPP